MYGCPLQANAQAFGIDERTVRNWWQRAGLHCQTFHECMLDQNQLELGQVQADEIKAKTQKGSIWMAMAMMVSTRLWLGGAVSTNRDTSLLQQMAQQVRRIALCRPLLIAVDGLEYLTTAGRERLVYSRFWLLPALLRPMDTNLRGYLHVEAGILGAVINCGFRF